MKTVRVLLFAFGIFLLSGCSSTFLADFVRPSQQNPQPDEHWYDDPWFQTAAPEALPPDYGSQPAYGSASQVQAPNAAGSNTVSNSGVVRRSGDTGTQRTTQTTTTATVPTRGNTGTLAGAAQGKTQEKPTQDRNGKR